jgi:hypothetical protein
MFALNDHKVIASNFNIRKAFSKIETVAACGKRKYDCAVCSRGQMDPAQTRIIAGAIGKQNILPVGI